MARSSATDRRFLEKHGGQWRVTVAVPRDLHDRMPTRLKRPLHTDSLAVANRLKWPVIAELKAEIDRARGGTVKAKHIQDALEMAEMLRKAKTEEEREAIREGIMISGEAMLGPLYKRGEDPDTGEPIYEHHPEREAAAGEFVRVALGKYTLVDLHHGAYLESLTVKSRTRADDVRAMKYLKEWCKRESVEPALQAINRKVAVRFMDGFPQLAKGISPVTLNKYLRRLSRYWQWLERREEVDTNVWKGLTLPTPETPYNEKERPFTDDEMRRLLTGETTQHMHDLMRIAALTGARIDVIVSLRVKDCEGGVFVFKPQKKEEKERITPIHSSLVPIIKRRTKGKSPEDDLFPEWPPVKKAGSMRERSFKASNQFTEYRRSVGVDEVIPGKRRSLVNFHSFRRWFSTQAERADQPEHLIAAVVGHKRSGITLGRYSAGPLVEQARRCVEAVKLPSLESEASPREQQAPHEEEAA